MKPGKVVIITGATVIGVSWLAKKVNVVGRVWPIR